MDELIIREEYNQYPDIISYDKNNPTLHSPYSEIDIFFYQTRETLQDIDTFRNFLKNAESRFRASKEYNLVDNSRFLRILPDSLLKQL